MTAGIRVRNLSKVYALAEVGGGPVSLLDALRAGRREVQQRQVTALDGVSFDISNGERVGIIGRNGAGKTTLLSLLSGITDPTTGDIEIDGTIHAMLTIGAVLRDEATGRENIYLDAAVHGVDREAIDSRMDEIVAFAELGDFIDRPVRTYSSGMKARLAFSMGTFIDPDILIVDETLSVGDVFFAEKATRKMKDISSRGRIVITVSHSLGSIVEMCDRCLWLDQGRLVMDGPPHDVTKAYSKSVEQSDAKELSRKFGAESVVNPSSDRGMVERIALIQEGKELVASAKAFSAMTIVAEGETRTRNDGVDIELSLLRVDGRRILRRRLQDSGRSLRRAGPFRVEIDFEPFMLGADLYRVEIILRDAGGPISSSSRVFEVVDELGQFGGKPLLYFPPIITSHRVGD